MQMRIGMISFAHMHAASYANCLNQIDGVDIAGIFDEDETRGKSMAKRFCGEKYYSDYNKLLEQDMDAVIICSANSDHKEYVIAAAEAGCGHILCEKPIATTLEDAQAMIEKCQAGCKAFTGGEIKHHKDCFFYPDSFLVCNLL